MWQGTQGFGSRRGEYAILKHERTQELRHVPGPAARCNMLFERGAVVSILLWTPAT